MYGSGSPMRAWTITFCLLLTLLDVTASAAEKAVYDSNGRIVSLISSAEDFPVTSSVVAVLPSGRRVPLQVRGPSAATVRPKDDSLIWLASFALPDNAKGRIEVRSTED